MALRRGIVGFDSVAACAAWTQTADTELVKPDLLIVDYRLENGVTGVDALAVLRARFGSPTAGYAISLAEFDAKMNELGYSPATGQSAVTSGTSAVDVRLYFDVSSK